jgi:SAM-dependent methyltransferase
MDPQARADIVEWDIQNWSAALAYWHRHSSLSLPKCVALEIGSRHGGLSLWLALCGATVVCSDVDGPTDAAVLKHARYGMSKRVRYERLDVMNIPYAGAFDLVVFKSVLGAVGRDGERERQRRAVHQMYHALKPGGELWFAENLIGSPVHSVLRARYVQWGQRWRYVSVADLMDFFDPFMSVSYATWGVLGVLGRTERQRSLLGRMDQMFLNACVPDHWRYIAAGVARK